MMVVMTEEKERKKPSCTFRGQGGEGFSYGLETHPVLPAPRPHTLIYLNHKKNNTNP